jgi:hypothetical protein
MEPRAIGFLMVYCALALATLARQGSYPKQGYETNLIYTSYSTLLILVFLLAGAWFWSAPIFVKGSFKLLLVASLLPLIFNLFWHLLPVKLLQGVTWRDGFLLPVTTFLIIGTLLSLIANWVFVRDPFNGDLAVNSQDRSYWYVERKLDATGTNIANSYGFLGPEPDKSHLGTIVLLIGDSIPAAGRVVNYPQLTQRMFEQDLSYTRSVQIINASMG